VSQGYHRLRHSRVMRTAAAVLIVLVLLPGAVRAESRASVLQASAGPSRQFVPGIVRDLQRPPSTTAQYASPPSGRLQDVSAAQRPADSGDIAIYSGDLNVPDGTVFQPGAHFVKEWRLKNIGTTTWHTGYTWRFQAGTLMSTTTSVSVPYTAPGLTAVISVPMTAPMATGVYTSFWQMSNAAAVTFPHQAWVNIVVRNGSTAQTPTRVNVSTANPTATAAAVPTQTAMPLATAQPTVDVPGGNGQLVASPWTGALDYRTYFSAGSTAGPMRESVALYDPGADQAHVRMTLYRPDSAQRILQFSLPSGGRRVFNLNKLAPGTGFSLAVESDRRVVVERLVASQEGLVGDPGAARTARIWYFAAMPPNSPSIQQLILFNPHDVSVVAHVRVGDVAGSCCAAEHIVTVPPLRQIVYQLGASDTLRGPITVLSSGVVAIERVAVASDQTQVVVVPGAVTLAKHWYLPEISASKGGGITLFNTSATSIVASIRTALDEGSGPWLQRTVPAFSQVLVPITELTSAGIVAAQIDSITPLIAGTEWYSAAGLPTAGIASPASATSWAFIGGLAGRGVSETLSIINPSPVASLVSIRVIGDKSGGTYWTVNMPAHSRYSRVIDNIVPSGGATVKIDASQPVTVDHRISDQYGATASPGALLSGS
jgi:Ig-like domain from next to BRCA1 gene